MGTIAPLLAPKSASAAAPTPDDSGINLISVDDKSFSTCQAEFTTGAMNLKLVQAAFSTLGKLDVNRIDDLDVFGPVSADSFTQGLLTTAQIAYLKNELNTTPTPIVPYVTFVPANNIQSASVVNGRSFVPATPDGFAKAICGSYVMIPVGPDTNGSMKYLMAVGHSRDATGSRNNDTRRIGQDTLYIDTMSFTPNPGVDATSTKIFGNLLYDLNLVGDCLDNGCSTPPVDVSPLNSSPSGVSFTVAGPINTAQPPAGGGAGNPGVIGIHWINASQIQVVSTGDPNASSNEIYQKLEWGDTPSDGYSYYFLTTPSTTNVPRTTVDSSSIFCSDPLKNGTSAPQLQLPCNDQGNQNCVPFFATQVDLDDHFTPPDNDPTAVAANQKAAGDLQHNIDALGGGGVITYYDFTPAGSTCSFYGSTTNVVKRVGSPLSTPQTWLYYSPTDDEFVTVFSSGGTNESTVIGTYSKSKSIANAYVGPGGACTGQLTTAGGHATTDNIGQLFPGKITWSFISGDCSTNSTMGSIKVDALVVDHNTFAALASAVSATNSNDSGPKVACDILASNPLNWIACPVVDATTALVGFLANLINNSLSVPTDVFSNPNFKAVWNAFRLLSFGGIAIIALLFALSESLGLGIFSAIDVKKIPQLLLAMIFMAFSWQILNGVALIANDLVVGGRQLIYSSFSSLPQTQLNGGADFTIILFGSGALLGLGWVGLLSFALTAAISALICVAILIFLRSIFEAAVIVATMGILMSIFAPKIGKIWRDLAFGIPLAFVAISWSMALVRCLSATALNEGGPINQFISVIDWDASLFVPLAILKLLSTIGKLAGIGSDAARGPLDRLRKNRGARVNDRMSRLSRGSLLNPESALTRRLGGNLINAAGERVGVGMRGRFGFGRTGRAMVASRNTLTAEDAARENLYFKEKMDNQDVMAALAFGNNEAELRNLEHFRDEHGNIRENDLAEAMAGARAIGITRRNMTAGADALSKTGKVIRTRAEAERLYDVLAGRRLALGGRRSNGALRGSRKGAYQWTSRGTGRADIGRDNAYDSLRELNTTNMGQQKGESLRRMFGTEYDPVSGGMVSQFDQAINDPRALADPEERQHLYTTLFAAQDSASLTPEQHAAIQRTIGNIEARGDAEFEEARERYFGKLVNPGGAPPRAARRGTARPGGPGAPPRGPGAGGGRRVPRGMRTPPRGRVGP